MEFCIYHTDTNFKNNYQNSLKSKLMLKFHFQIILIIFLNKLFMSITLIHDCL